MYIKVCSKINICRDDVYWRVSESWDHQISRAPIRTFEPKITTYNMSESLDVLIKTRVFYLAYNLHSALYIRKKKKSNEASSRSYALSNPQTEKFYYLSILIRCHENSICLTVLKNSSCSLPAGLNATSCSTINFELHEINRDNLKLFNSEPFQTSEMEPLAK